MLELGAGADILRGLGWLYIGLIVVLVIASLWFPKRWWQKATGVLVVLMVFTGPAYLRNRERKEVVGEQKARYEKAKALFDEKCKTAGEKIYRTVEDVEGIFVMKPRTESLNYSQQFKLDDPYGYSGTGEGYLKLFVRGRPTVPARTGELINPANVVSYKFAEIADETGQSFYRYTTPMGKDESERISRNGGGTIPLEKVPVKARAARYGITWEDISTPEDREHWIAGSSLKIVDVNTNELMAERIGYMFDRALGDTSGGRSPWSAARDNACPPLNERTFYFFDRVIQPSRGATK